jgi:hypothetical protein
LLIPPFVPPKKENFADRAIFDNDPWLQANIDLVKQHRRMLKQPCIQNLFVGYFYDHELTRGK